MEKTDHMERAMAIEKEMARRRGFRKGLLVGFFIPVIMLSVLVITVVLSRSYIEKKAGEMVVSKAMSELFSSFPDAYFTHNREKVIEVFDKFTNAASNHQINSAEFSGIGRQFLGAVKDKQLTYAELDEILAKMAQASQ